MELKLYETKYEKSWLRCRVLSFLETAYYDDVYTNVPIYEQRNAKKFIAVENEQVIGLIDVVWDGEATKESTLSEGKGGVIEHLAVHPDFQNRGVAQQLYDAAVQVFIAEQVNFVEVWTRDDVGANQFYKKQGFEVASHYFHVYGKKYQEADATLISGFYHVFNQSELMQYHRKRTYSCYGYLKLL